MTRVGVPIAQPAEESERADAAEVRPPAPALAPCANGPRGDGRVREELLAQLDALYRFILVRVGFNESVADDVLQETAQAALRSDAPESVGSLEGWLRGVAKNLVRRHWRDAARRNGHGPDREAGRRVLEALESGCPAEAVERRELRMALLWAIGSLPASDQWLLYAVYRHGASHARLAEELGCTHKGIEMRLYRTRVRLREALAACGEGT